MVWNIIIWIALTIVSYLISSRNTSQQTSVTPGNLEATTVDSSSPVPVLFGTRLLTSANCVWYGDVGTTPIVQCA